MPVRSNLKKKRKAYRFGLWAEVLAIVYYLFKGYVPIARRYKTKLGEIDLIVASKSQIIFVEVKARRGEGAFPLHPKQVERIQHAAMLFVAKQKRFATLPQQVDLLIIRPFRLPKRVSNI
jgi:putative endonuclease